MKIIKSLLLNFYLLSTETFLIKKCLEKTKTKQVVYFKESNRKRTVDYIIYHESIVRVSLVKRLIKKTVQKRRIY